MAIADYLPSKTAGAALEDVRDGDLLFFSRKGFIAWCIRRVTRSQWSHVSIAFWEGELLVVHEASKPHRTRVPLLEKVAESTDGAVLARSDWVTPERLQLMHRYALDNFPSPYGLRHVVEIALGFRRYKPQQFSRPTCSEFVDQCFRSAGKGFKYDDRGFLSPQNIADDPTVRGVCRMV
jgi:hypothetical protein